MDDASFLTLLQNMTQIDNEIRNKAEAEFESAKALHGQSILNSLSRITVSEAPDNIIALALTLLRKMFAKTANYYEIEPPASQEAIKANAIQAFTMRTCTGQMRLVSACLAALVAKIYSLNGTWNDLWVNLFETIKNTSAYPMHRAGSCEVLASCSTVMTPYLTNHYSDLVMGLTSCIACESPEVKKSAVYAAVEVLSAVPKSSIRSFQGLPQCILDSVAASLNTGDSDTATVLLSNMCELIEHSPAVVKDSTETILRACMQIASTSTLDSSVRHVSMEALTVMCESNTKFTKKVSGFCTSYLDLLFSYTLNLDIPEDWDVTSDVDAAETEGTSDFDVAVTSFDRVVTALGNKVCAEHIQTIITTNLKHANWQNRNGALSVLTYTVEGLRDVFITHMEFIVGLVCQLKDDPNKVVRFAVYQCLSQISTDFAPSFEMKLHSSVIPVMLYGCDDPLPRVHSVAISAINSFFDDAENGDEDETSTSNVLAPYINSVCEKLICILQTSQYQFVRSAVLSALSSVIATGKKHLIPLVNHLVPIFQTILSLPDQSDSEARLYKCKAIECTTLLASSVEFQHFSEYAHPVCEFLSQLMSEKLSTDDPLLPYALRGWTNMVDCLQENVLPYLPNVMPQLVDLAKLECDMVIANHEVGDELEQKEEDGTETMLMCLPGKGDVVVKTKTALIDEKKIAAQIIVEVLRTLKGKLAPYLKDFKDVGTDLVNFCSNGDLRVIGCELYDLLLEAYEEAFPTELATYGREVIEVMMECIKSERQFEIIGNFLDTLGNMVKASAPMMTEKELTELSKLLMGVLKESVKRKREALKSVEDCISEDEDEMEVLQEEIDNEEFLVDELRGLSEKMMEYIPPFTHLFETDFMPIIMQLVQSDISGDVSLGLSFLASYIEKSADCAAAAHLTEIVPPILHHITHKDNDVKQNAINALRVCLDLCRRAFPQPHEGSLDLASTAITTLSLFLSLPTIQSEELSGPLNNAISAYMVIIEHYGQYLPAETVAGLARTVVSFAPLKDGDEIEAKYVHLKLAQMVKGGHSAVGGLQESIIGKLRAACADCLCEETVAMLKDM
eukprot:Tbor_TRINITY_DN5425_c1_g1::TRINITY_DN5425_c1_g1_i1::g.24306::m.24306/K20222/IPO5, KPNB3, RANBP5; importin-5